MSLRMALAEIPVVAVLKSMWLLPRTRALKESVRGIKEAMALVKNENKDLTDYEEMYL